jgi:virulence factor Mce-like protein
VKPRRRTVSVAANPVLIGAVTTLVVTIAVFLAYNANAGLPFVPTYQFKVDAPDAARLVVGNDVREGGFRIGQVTDIETIRKRDGDTGAELTVQLDDTYGPIPKDSGIEVRPRSALGLKYLELVRGSSPVGLQEGATITATQQAIPPEFDDLFNMFDPRTREHIETNLEEFGGGFAGRGTALNRTIAALPELLRDLVPVMRTLSDPDTQLARMLRELDDAARVAAPVAGPLARGFTAGADVFEALSRDPEALKATISESPPTLDEGLRSLPAQRPFLRRLAAISDEVRGTAREVRRSVPGLNRALAAGIPVLRRTPRLNQDLTIALRALRTLSTSPTTNLALDGLTATFATLNPTLRFIGPHITVCNYWNYWWTHLADHLSEEDATGTLQRIQVKNAPRQTNGLTSFGATEPANGEGADPVTTALEGDPAHLHKQEWGRAVDEQGNADCEVGQRGYPERVAANAPPNFKIAIDPRTPGSQGPTFTGKPRVPAGQTFSAEPTGLAPPVTP